MFFTGAGNIPKSPLISISMDSSLSVSFSMLLNVIFQFVQLTPSTHNNAFQVVPPHGIVLFGSLSTLQLLDKPQATNKTGSSSKPDKKSGGPSLSSQGYVQAAVVVNVGGDM